MSYKPEIIERYEKLFAIISMEKGFITTDILIEALTVQIKEQAENGKNRFVRENFLDDHTISFKEIDDVCTIIFQLQNPSTREPLPQEKSL